MTDQPTTDKNAARGARSRQHYWMGHLAILTCAFMGGAFAQNPLESATWRSKAGGEIPDGALAAGLDDGGGRTLYSCRAKFPLINENFLGKIGKGFKGCLVVLTGQNVATEVTTYEVLMNISTRWVDVTGGALPPGAVEGGLRADGAKKYICRATPSGSNGALHLGSREAGTCDVEYYGRVEKVPAFQVLTYPWTHASNGSIPPGAFPVGKDVGGEDLYSCRGSVEQNTFFGVRSLLEAGKVRQGFEGCFVALSGASKIATSYEVLTNFSGSWVAAANGALPENTLHAAYMGFGAYNDQFVCRAVPATPNARGTKHPGSLAGSTNECRVSFGNNTGYSVTTYEALVPDSKPYTASAEGLTLSAQPASLSFQYQVNGASPAAQNVMIRSTAATTFTVDTPTAPWLLVTPTRASTPEGIRLAVDTNGLQPGIFSAVVKLRAANESTLSIPVELTVTARAAAGLSVSPNAVTASFQAGGTPPAAQQIAVTVPTGAQNIAFSVDAIQAPWLTVTPSTGTTPASLLVTFNSGSAPAGNLTTNIVIRPSGQGAMPPITIPVTLTNSDSNSNSTQNRGMMIAQIADGAGWRTTINLVNRDTEPAPFTLRFWSATGAPLPLAFDGNPGPKTATLEGTLAPGGSRIINTQGIDPVVSQGWAELTSSKSVGAVAVFRSPEGQEAGVGLTAAVKQFFLPFDNMQLTVTSMALINANATDAAAVTVTLRDEFGTVISTETMALPARGHSAFSLPIRFPASDKRRGVAEFSTSAPDITALGLRFSPNGAFTSFPVQTR